MTQAQHRVIMPVPPGGGRRDQLVLLRNVPWEQYEALCAARGESATPRLTYLEGELEIMSPGENHEDEKKLIARLVEAYGDERGIRLLGRGSTTYRKKAKRRGLEPDECYSVGEAKKVPDFAIEVVQRSGGIDKLTVYQGLGVPEVWFWVARRFRIYFLAEDGYEERDHSHFLPELDLTRLGRIVAVTDLAHQADAVWEFRRTLKKQGGKG